MPAKKKPVQKRVLDDPGDISISVTPAPTKKMKAPAAKKGPKATMNSEVNTPSPATGAPATLPATTATKPRPRMVGKPKESAPSLSDGPVPDASAEAAPPVAPAKSSKRDKKPSAIAQKGTF
jgi:hypothetical protein